VGLNHFHPSGIPPNSVFDSKRLVLANGFQVLYPDSFTEDRLLSFTITNNILSNVSFTQTGGCYLGGCGICSGSCDVIFPGQGTFDEVTLVLSYSGDDCVGFVEVMLFLTRQ